MGTRSGVKLHTDRAMSAKSTDEKLNAIAAAIYELADFIDDLENKLNRLEKQLR